MIEPQQIWRHNSSNQQIRICDIDNKIVVGELLPSGARMFTTIFALRADYQRVINKNLRKSS